MTPGPLLHVLSDAATARPELVLMDGHGSYWRIESIIRQARRDQKTHHELREGTAYSWGYMPRDRTKIVVYHYGVPVFWEPGTEI